MPGTRFALPVAMNPLIKTPALRPGLPPKPRRTTLSYMIAPKRKTALAKAGTSQKVARAGKSATLTIRIDPQMARLLDELGRETNQSRSDIARDALRRQLRLARFDAARKRLMPLAEAQGILTDDDVFGIVS